MIVRRAAAKIQSAVVQLIVQKTDAMRARFRATCAKTKEVSNDVTGTYIFNNLKHYARTPGYDHDQLVKQVREANRAYGGHHATNQQINYN